MHKKWKLLISEKNIQRRFGVYKTSTGLEFLWKQKNCNVIIDIDLSTGKRPVSYFFPFLIIHSTSYVKGMWLVFKNVQDIYMTNTTSNQYSGEWVKEHSYLK